MMTNFNTALRLWLLLTIATGLAYPLAVSGIAAIVFPGQANGSLLQRDGRVVGSEWVGQSFTRPEYLWGRPSATGAIPYDGSASSGSNLGPNNPALKQAVQQRVAALVEAEQQVRSGSQDKVPSTAFGDRPVPVDLVLASASGLDPHISPAGADFQVPRIAGARNVEEQVVRQIIQRHTEGRWLGFWGEPRVHVLRVNLELDQASRRIE